MTPVVSLNNVWEDSIKILAQHIPNLHNQLVSPADESEVVVVVKIFWDVLAKCVAGSTGRDSPAASVVRVWPQ